MFDDRTFINKKVLCFPFNIECIKHRYIYVSIQWSAMKCINIYVYILYYEQVLISFIGSIINYERIKTKIRLDVGNIYIFFFLF